MQRPKYIFSYDALCQKPHGLQWLMFFGIHPFSFETDFLNPDPSDSWVATDLVFPPPYPPEGLLLVPPLFSAKSAQEVAARGVSCNNCLLEKHTYNHQPCYVLPRDENVISSKVLVKLVRASHCSSIVLWTVSSREPNKGADCLEAGDLKIRSTAIHVEMFPSYWNASFWNYL